LSGENLGYKRMGLSTILVFVGGGLAALALYLKTGLIGVAASTFAATCLTGILFLQVARSYVPWFGIAKPAWESVRQFAGLSGWFLAWNLVMKLMRASDVVLLGILSSAELVTTYSLTKYVPETLINLVAIVVFGATPGLGGIIGSGNLQKAVRIRNEMMIFTWLITTVAGATILLWNKSFLQLWVGAEYSAGALPTLLIILLVIQFVLIRNDANLIDLTLDLRRKVFTGFLSTALALVVAGVLVRFYNAGITGLCLGFLAGRLILSLVYPWLVGRFLSFPLSSQLKGILRPVFVSILLFGMALHLEEFLKAKGWIDLILSIGLTVAIVEFIAFYGGITGEQRQPMRERLHLLIGRQSS
ncbi:MAG: lipopolysaccharide biosynthesis protein, partial [bacterium]